MSGRILTATVHLYHPDTSERVSFVPGDELPDWAEGMVTNPAAFAPPEEPAPFVDEAPNVNGDAGGIAPRFPDFDTEANIKEILEWVADDPERAAYALEAEQAKGEEARTTLVTRLDEIAGGQPPSSQ